MQRMRRRILLILAATTLVVLPIPAGWAQQPIEITKADLTKQKTIDASQVIVLGVRLGDPKEQALKTLQGLNNVKVQEDAASGRIFVYSPATSNLVVMSVRAIEGMVTTINLVGGFGEWLQGDSRTLFRGFEDDSLRYKLIGREDQRQELLVGKGLRALLSQDAGRIGITAAVHARPRIFPTRRPAVPGG